MASGLDQWLGKLEAHNEIGEALTQRLQKAEEEVQQYVGGRTALKAAAEKVGALGAIVEADLNEGKLSFDSELKAAEYVKRTIIRAREILLNLADGTQSREIASAGKVSALKESRELVLRHCLTAKARAEQLTAAAKEIEEQLNQPPSDEDGEADIKEPRQPRASGQHPARSSLDERRAQAALERARAATEGDSPVEGSPAVEGEVVAVEETVEVSVPEPVKKKRGRPRKVRE
jgi:hypothetical protein